MDIQNGVERFKDVYGHDISDYVNSDSKGILSKNPKAVYASEILSNIISGFHVKLHGACVQGNGDRLVETCATEEFIDNYEAIVNPEKLLDDCLTYDKDKSFLERTIAKCRLTNAMVKEATDEDFGEYLAKEFINHLSLESELYMGEVMPELKLLGAEVTYEGPNVGQLVVDDIKSSYGGEEPFAEMMAINRWNDFQDEMQGYHERDAKHFQEFIHEFLRAYPNPKEFIYEVLND